MIFNKRRVTQLERRCEFLEDDVKALKGEVKELQMIVGQLIGEGLEIKTEVQWIPDDHLLEQKH